MLRNYLKTAFRSFVKDRKYALVNLLGLATGLAGVMIISAYVKYELSFDRWYSHSDRIYKIVVEERKDSVVQPIGYPDPLPYTLKDEFPEIESVSRLSRGGDGFIIHGRTLGISDAQVDSSFLQVFNFPFITGNARSALRNENSIVLTQSAAKKLFPDQNPVGRQLTYKDYKGGLQAYNVTGVIRDIPSNTHFSTEAFVSKTPAKESLSWNGYRSSGDSYIMLKQGTDIDQLNKKLPTIYKKYGFPEHTKVIFQPVTAIHLRSASSDGTFSGGNIRYVYIFSFIAILILFIACINYINLSVARSLQRIREVGMRKVMGAQRKQLIGQFISESVLFFCSALPVAFLIAYLLWPFFCGIMDIELSRIYLLNGKFILLIICAGLLTGVLAGSYPAFFLSRLNPISILKDWQKSFALNLRIRKSLIVFQFAISIALIICTLVVYRQLHFMNNMPLGFNKDYLVSLPLEPDAHGKVAAFKQALKSGKDVLGVTAAEWAPGGYRTTGSQNGPSGEEWDFAYMYADLDFLKTMQIKLREGRDFSSSYASDMVNVDSVISSSRQKLSHEELNLEYSQSVLITEKTVQNLGLKEPVVGQVLKYSALRGTVIGVIDDFIGTSLLKENPMVVIRCHPDYEGGNMYIRINSKNIPQTMAFLERTRKKFFPENQLSFSFVDDDIADLYREQQRLATMFTAFAVLAILIAVMGLFSLVALTVQQKTKEIGIRKVLGADVAEIVRLLSGSFVRLILIGLLIASPVAWWAMNKWLQDFPYRTQISWWIFFASGISALLLALLVISIQSARAAMANPVKSLRTE